MNVKMTQYTDRIYLDNCSGQKLIEINYSGSFVGEIVPEGVTVMMNKNKICQGELHRKLKLKDIWNITHKYCKIFEKNTKKENLCLIILIHL